MKKLLSIVLSIFVFVSCSNKTEFEKNFDKLADEFIFKKPDVFLGTTYCYYVYQNIIDPAKVTPELFKKHVKGSALSTKHIQGYNEWLTKDQGRLCKDVVKVKFYLIIASKYKDYFIFLNKTAIEADGDTLTNVQAHERLHVIYANFKEGQAKVEKMWNEQSAQKKQEFIAKHPGYNFDNKSILLREFFSYSFQSNPEEGYKFISM